MTWEREATPLFSAAVWLAALGIPTALLSGRAEVLVITTPFLVLAAVAILATTEPDLDVLVRVDSDRALEGDELDATVELSSARGAPLVRLAVVPIAGGRDLPAQRIGASVEPAEVLEIPLRVDTMTWGVRGLRLEEVEVSDRWGLVRHRRRVGRSQRVRVYPAPDRLRALVTPRRPPPRRGPAPSPRVGDGLEFASTRPFRPGDRVRSINWRATARRRELWVSEHHDERAADVVLLIDTMRATGSTPEAALLTAVRAADVLSEHYLRDHGRVGVVTFGSTVRWLLPGTGMRQRYQIAELLIEAEVQRTVGWQHVDALPARTLPPGALLLALTPLVDRRIHRAVGELRARRHDIAVIDVGPRMGIATTESDLEGRIHALQRDAAIAELAATGVAVATWPEDKPLTRVLEEVEASRRYATLR